MDQRLDGEYECRSSSSSCPWCTGLAKPVYAYSTIRMSSSLLKAGMAAAISRRWRSIKWAADYLI